MHLTILNQLEASNELPHSCGGFDLGSPFRIGKWPSSPRFSAPIGMIERWSVSQWWIESGYQCIGSLSENSDNVLGSHFLGSSLHVGDEKCPETMSTDWSIGHPFSVSKKRLEVLGIQMVFCLGERRRPKKVSRAHSRSVPLVQVICTCFSDPALNMMRNQSRKGWHIWKSLYLPYLAQL